MSAHFPRRRLDLGRGSRAHGYSIAVPLSYIAPARRDTGAAHTVRAYLVLAVPRQTSHLRITYDVHSIPHTPFSALAFPPRTATVAHRAHAPRPGRTRGLPRGRTSTHADTHCRGLRANLSNKCHAAVSIHTLHGGTRHLDRRKQEQDRGRSKAQQERDVEGKAAGAPRGRNAARRGEKGRRAGEALPALGGSRILSCAPAERVTASLQIARRRVARTGAREERGSSHARVRAPTGVGSQVMRCWAQRFQDKTGQRLGPRCQTRSTDEAVPVLRCEEGEAICQESFAGARAISAIADGSMGSVMYVVHSRRVYGIVV
ncbi:hypothetical protein WOLCODRAFT_168031 [Wolfiporia cocos MD-104 SS10]|uniref:Uncharacterized protein n=1 Tax=Wolfiporia cocos (strain MD-104) TaxID=742152 RepID=A0A2H3JLC9_WOLCO|nr:hypothetical protein WOLCODRAFT_168031 [Wolfiporia cocos MD-104 SS10]